MNRQTPGLWFIQHALEQGTKTVHVRTLDTYVIVILAGLFHDLLVIQPLTDIWVAFGMGKKYRFCHINSICKSLGKDKSRALLMFHAYSGCDTTSAFSGKGKKSVWLAWQAYDEATEVQYLLPLPEIHSKNEMLLHGSSKSLRD